MKKEYAIDFKQVIVMDGDDMLDAVAISQRAELSDGGISINIHGIRITVSKESFLSLYRYCVKVTDIAEDISCYYFMCASEFPSGIEDSVKNHLVFVPGQYVADVFGNIVGHYLWYEYGFINALLSFECRYGDKDSYYNNLMRRLSGANIFYGVNMEDGGLKEYRAFDMGTCLGPFFFYERAVGSVGLGVRLTISNPLHHSYIYVDKVVDDDIFVNTNTSPIYEFQSVRKSDDGSVSYMFFLTEAAANAELLRFRDEIIKNITEKLKSIRGEGHKMMEKINTLRNL